MRKITKDSIFTRNTEKFLSTEVDGEAVIMNSENGNYLGLNEVSTYIWKLLSEEKTYELILLDLLQEYKVSRKKCDAETRGLLFTMLKMDIIKFKES